ncbi:MAG TPA: PIG-L family deacetylase, partial [Actinomycetota bacterium]|nr:PIG-L family deacetylase [Actinomycetota bacterium]
TVTRPLTVAGIFAHPDDETWSLAGSFALLVPKGVRGAVWTATRGQAGQIAEESGATRETVAEVREGEERAAMAVVGVERVFFGDLVDGEVEQADRDALAREIHGFMEREQPDVVVTMEPAGVTAHPDHMAVSAATQAAFGAYASTGREREPRFYYWGVPVSDMASWRALGRASGYELPGEDDPYGGRGTPDDQFTCTVDTSTVAEQAYRALCRHRTQAGDVAYRMLDHQEGWRSVFGRSRYIRVHPAPRPGDPPETSLVEAFGNG